MLEEESPNGLGIQWDVILHCRGPELMLYQQLQQDKPKETHRRCFFLKTMNMTMASMVLIDFDGFCGLGLKMDIRHSLNTLCLGVVFKSCAWRIGL